MNSSLIPKSFKTNVVKTASVIVVSILGTIILLGKDLQFLINLVRTDDAYTHLVIIPLVSAYFIWTKRKLFLKNKGNRFAGIILILCGALIATVIHAFTFKDPMVSMVFKSIGILLVIYGIFVSCWGWKALKASLFSFIFLILAIPIPVAALDHIIKFLQHGSAVMVEGIFTMLGQTFMRDNNSFYLQTISITIAPECSGIRSTMALIITGAIAAEMFLKTWWRKILILLVIIPLSLLKNAIRIVTITMLAQYVDIAFLTHSFLHHSGGIFFYLIVLAIFFPLLFLLGRTEPKEAGC